MFYVKKYLVYCLLTHTEPKAAVCDATTAKLFYCRLVHKINAYNARHFVAFRPIRTLIDFTHDKFPFSGCLLIFKPYSKNKTMQELINRLVAEGLTEQQALKAIEIVKDFAKEKFPLFAGAINKVFDKYAPKDEDDFLD